MPGTAKRKLRAQRLALLKRFLREHTWGVMIAGLILIAVDAVRLRDRRRVAEDGGRAGDRRRTDTPRYESGYICAITTQVPYYD